MVDVRRPGADARKRGQSFAQFDPIAMLEGVKIDPAMDDRIGDALKCFDFWTGYSICAQFVFAEVQKCAGFEWDDAV